MYIAKTLRMMNFLVREGFDCINIKVNKLKLKRRSIRKVI